jgi:hypothetical protein
VYGIYAQRARRRRRVISRASGPLLAVCALSGLLLIGPGVARAGPLTAPGRPHSAAATGEPAAAPGGQTMAAATQLETGLDYRGTVVPGQQLWYKLDAAGQRAFVEVRGETPLCSVQASVLDANGRPLGELISSTRETLPLIAYFPAHPVSGVYYLRIAANPYAPCASTDYVFKLVEPEQPEKASCQTIAGPNGEPRGECTLPSKESDVPAFEARACASDRTVFNRVNVEVARVRALVARRRASVRALRQLEGEERSDHRRMNVRCLL